MLRTDSAGRGKLTNARVDGHVHAHGLICHYCERLRCCPDVPPSAVLDIQNVISWRQRNAILSSLVRCHARDFFLFVTGQDNQRIIGVVVLCISRRRCVGKLDLAWRNDFQMFSRNPGACASAEPTPRATNSQAKSALVRDDDMTAKKEMGGIDFHYPAQRLIELYGNVSCQALRPCVAA